MDEARRVLERLDRIEALRSGAAPPRSLLGEVQALLEEAEAWVRVEGTGVADAEDALERTREALQNGRRTLVA